MTKWIEGQANTFLADGLRQVVRVPYRAGVESPNHAPHKISHFTWMTCRSGGPAAARVNLGVPLGGASLAYWEAIATHYKLNLHRSPPSAS